MEVEEEAVEAEEEEALQQAEQRLPGEEEMRNSSERNHPPSPGIDRTLTDSSRTFKDICP